MKTDHPITRFWLWGGLAGLLFPLALIALCLILNCFHIAFGEHFLTELLICAIACLELPAVIVGRALNLPIEAGGAAFIIYDLNLLGYILALLFWTGVGLLVGYVIDRLVHNPPVRK